MKSIETKKYNIDRCYVGLLNIVPNKFKDIKEIEMASEILDLLEPFAKDHFSLLKEGDTISEEFSEISKEDSNFKEVTKKIANLNIRIKDRETKDREKVITVEFENEEFNEFFQFFERWGKDWFMKIKEFIDFRKDLNKTNQKPKK